VKNFIENHLTMTLNLLVVGGSIMIGAWVADSNQKAIENKIRERITHEEEVILTLAKITDNNGADAVIESISSDCSRRTEYEALLMSLGTLSKKDLLLAQNLSESCGNFYVERKALMLSKLERELASYMEYVGLLEDLTHDSEQAEKTKNLTELISLEKTRSSLIGDQNVIQSKIISLLISGATVSSKDVVNLVVEARDISDLLEVGDLKIDEMRAKLE